MIDALERHWVITAAVLFAGMYFAVNYGVKVVLAAFVLGMGALI